MMPGGRTHRQGERGIGLIELMIAVVLVAFGFLAAARMQVQGMRFSQSAYNQSQAYFLASEMIDRMRVNLRGVQNGEYDGLTTSPSAVNPQCGLITCGPSTLAIQDLYDWSAQLHALDGQSTFLPALPSGDSVPATGEIISLGQDPNGNNLFQIKMTWSEIVNGSEASQSLDISFTTERPALL